MPSLQFTGELIRVGEQVLLRPQVAVGAESLSDAGEVLAILSSPTFVAWPDLGNFLASGSSYHALLPRQRPGHRPTEAKSLHCWRLLQENPAGLQGMKCKRGRGSFATHAVD